MRQILVSTLLLCSSCFANDTVLTELRQQADHEYQNLDLMPAFEHSMFYNPINGRYIDGFIKNRDVSIVIEVGSWLGGSAIFMAERLASGDQLYAIDHWKGSGIYTDTDQCRPLLPTLYEQFLSNVVHAGMDSIIVPIKKSSSEAFAYLEGHILADLIYIDGAHETEAVYEDITLYSQLLAEDGIITGDDWTWPTVRAAVERYAQENNKTIRLEGNFWYYEPNN